MICYLLIRKKSRFRQEEQREALDITSYWWISRWIWREIVLHPLHRLYTNSIE